MTEHPDDNRPHFRPATEFVHRYGNGTGVRVFHKDDPRLEEYDRIRAGVRPDRNDIT